MPLNLMVKKKSYIKTFGKIGSSINADTDLLESIERFVCHLCGRDNATNVDLLRYQMYCQSGAKIACELLPPVMF